MSLIHTKKFLATNKDFSGSQLKEIREASISEYPLKVVKSGGVLSIRSKKWSNADELKDIFLKVLTRDEVQEVKIVEYLRYPAFKVHLNYKKSNLSIDFADIAAIEKLADCEAMEIDLKAFTMIFKYY